MVPPQSNNPGVYESGADIVTIMGHNLTSSV